MSGILPTLPTITSFAISKESCGTDVVRDVM